MPLLLTIDVGNTNTVLGVHDGEDLKAHWRLTTRREQTADEYGLLVRSLFAASNIDVAGCRSSMSPPATWAPTASSTAWPPSPPTAAP